MLLGMRTPSLEYSATFMLIEFVDVCEDAMPYRLAVKLQDIERNSIFNDKQPIDLIGRL